MSATRAFASAIKNHGTTSDIREAGYILPDGTMLDFSGKAESGVEGRRYIDHIDIQYDGMPGSNVRARNRFMEIGAMRVDARAQFVSIEAPMSDKQMDMAIQILAPGSGRIEANAGKSRYFFAAPTDEQGARRAVNEANRFLAGEDIPKGTRYSVTAKRQDLTAPDGMTQEAAIKALTALAGRDLVNLDTGIVAQVNSNQRDKLISNAAAQKSNVNGFTSNQHNAAASIIDRLWKHAILIDDRADRRSDKNVASIKRFAAPVLFDGETAIAYITAKESVSAGHRIYSLELTEIEKLRQMGSTLSKERATAGASINKVAELLSEVNSRFSIVSRLYENVPLPTQ